MHTQHVKFSTYVLGSGGEDVVIDAVADSLPSSSSSSSGGTGDEAAVASAVDVVVAVVVGVVAAIVVVAVVTVVLVVSFAPSLSPASSLFVPSSFFFLGNDAFFSASASAAAFNRLHSLLCPPAFQCFIWHSLLQ